MYHSEIVRHNRRYLAPDFHELIKSGNEVGAKQMIEKRAEEGADINEQSRSDGSTALHAATEQALPHLIYLLGAVRADPNIRDGEGLTPLHLAASVPVIEALKAIGADFNARDDSGDTPLERAKRYNDHELAGLLAKASPNVLTSEPVAGNVLLHAKTHKQVRNRLTSPQHSLCAMRHPLPLTPHATGLGRVRTEQRRDPLSGTVAARHPSTSAPGPLTQLRPRGLPPLAPLRRVEPNGANRPRHPVQANERR